MWKGRNSMTGSTQIAESWAEAWSARDVDKVQALLADFVTDDCHYEDVTFGLVWRGKDELMSFAEWFLAGVPDLRVEIRSSCGSEERVAFEWTMFGTNERSFGPGAPAHLSSLPATGKSFEVQGCSMAELQGDKVKRQLDYWDMATLMKQLGLLG
jgi:steroid delta-isomerase-like uncharacterized protein